jgi:predicted phage terminase large subunit-like protein
VSDPFVPKIELAAFYNAVMRARGFSLAAHHLPICTGLQDRRIKMFMVVTGPGNGKSTVTSTVYPAWELGHQPDTTILGIGAAEDLMQKFARGTAEIIKDNPVFHRIFPNVLPDKTTGWSPAGGYNVTGRPPGDPDASYLAVGLASKALTGKHAKIILLDDLHDKENSANKASCDKVYETYFDTILGRGDPATARYILSGRRFSVDDIYGRFIESGDWVVITLPAERKGETRLWWDVIVPRHPDDSSKPMECVYSETLTPNEVQDDSKPYIKYRAYYGIDPAKQGFYWPGNESKRREYFLVKRGSPYTAESTYQCNPSSRDNAVFVEDDFCYDSPFAGMNLSGGILDPAVKRVVENAGGRIVQAWDTGFGKSADSAYSVCITAMMVSSERYWRGEDPALVGPAERHNRVYIMDVRREKLDFAGLSGAFRQEYRKWDPEMVLVENRASGISLIQTMKTSGIPLRAVEAKEGKVQRATDSVGGGAGSVQGWFRQHRVVVPQGAKWLPDFKQEFLDFTGTNSGKKDQVDATVYLVAHAINSSIGLVRIPSDTVMAEANQDAQDSGYQSDNMAALLAAFAQPAIDPFETTCGRCVNWEGNTWKSDGTYNTGTRQWCGFHNRAASAVDSCSYFAPPIIGGRGSALVLR